MVLVYLVVLSILYLNRFSLFVVFNEKVCSVNVLLLISAPSTLLKRDPRE